MTTTAVPTPAIDTRNLKRGTRVVIDGRAGADFEATIRRREVVKSLTPGGQGVVFYALVGHGVMFDSASVREVLGR